MLVHDPRLLIKTGLKKSWINNRGVLDAVHHGASIEVKRHCVESVPSSAWAPYNSVRERQKWRLLSHFFAMQSVVFIRVGNLIVN
jgi:hypothetical protein